MYTRKTGRIVKKSNISDVLSRPDGTPTEAMGADLRSKHGVSIRALHLRLLSGFLYTGQIFLHCSTPNERSQSGKGEI